MHRRKLSKVTARWNARGRESSGVRDFQSPGGAAEVSPAREGSVTVRTTTTLRNAGGTPHLHTCPQSVIVVLDALYAIWQKYAQGGRGIVARCDCGVEW